ncbi:MAG: NTP transferase domain-containing protein [Planctomycetaceae bacterium]|jgi:mannose-1-phosphate guanylyltransferase|nr:NTP transferase domain-containing protein [Planctomycetaceae bacterium]
MLHAIILAGGSGTRLWPASRIAKPKHLLDFGERQTLLQATVERLTGLVPPDRTWIVTNRNQTDQIAQSLPQLDANHIWGEPQSRNTAVSIGWAAVKLRHVDSDAMMVVLPADHIIKPAATFCETIQCAADLVEKFPQTLATIGVKPTFPSTSYGYIHRGDVLAMPTGSAYHVHQFCEKPEQKIAEQFYQLGEHYWNAGIFVWKARTLLKLLYRFEPDIARCLDRIERSLGTSAEMPETEAAFKEMKSISIDYAVMERAEETIVLGATFDWNDVGTWTALDRLYADQKDKNENLAVSSQLLAIDSSGCTVRCENPEHLVALIGMHDVVVIQTADATLIARKDQEESVRRIAEELKKRNDPRWS